MAELDGAFVYIDISLAPSAYRSWMDHRLLDADLPFDDPAWIALHAIPSEQLGLKFRVRASNEEEATRLAREGEFDFDQEDIKLIEPEGRSEPGWWRVELHGTAEDTTVRSCLATLRMSRDDHAEYDYDAPRFTLEAYLNDVAGVRAWFEPLIRVASAAADAGATGTVCIMAAGTTSCEYVPFVGIKVNPSAIQTRVEAEYQNVCADMRAFMPEDVEERILVAASAY